MSMRLALSATFFLIFIVSASAVEWIDQKTGVFEYSPGSAENEHHFNGLTIADRVYVYYKSHVDPQTGQGWHRVIITNGINHKGFHACSQTRYFGDGVELVVDYRLGVNPGSSRDETRDITMSPQAWAKVKNYEIRAGWCPDSFGDRVEGLIDAIVEASPFGSDNSGPTPIQTEPSAPQVQQYYVWATVRCQRPGSTGGVQVEKTSQVSCEAAKQDIKKDAENGSCKMFAADATFTGKIEYSECKAFMAPAP